MPYTFMLFKLKTSLEYKMEISVKCYITVEAAWRIRKGFLKIQQFTDSTLLYCEQYTFRHQTTIYNKSLRNRHFYYCYYYYYCYCCYHHHHYHCVAVVIVVVVTSVTGLFFLVLLLNQQWSPLLMLQVSDYSTVHIMCHVPSVFVFCSESIECFPGTASKFFLKHFVTNLMAPVITGIILHFWFHIHCISIHKLL